MSVPNVTGNIVLSDGNASIGDAVALVSDDSIGILEGITSFAAGVNSGVTKFLFRADADASLDTYDADELRVLTAEELVTRNETVTLAEAQAAYDAASTALEDAGGTPCPG